MDITIYKSGRMIGPLNAKQVAERLARGEIRESDLAQRGDLPFWVPLRRLTEMEREASFSHRARRAVRDFAERAWIALNVRPLPAGLLCLAAGCALLLLAHWPVLLFGPPLLAAVFAGAVLMSRRQFAPGLILCAGAMLLPAVLLTLLQPASPPAPSDPVTVAPVIEHIVPPPAPATPVPLESLGGLALPQPLPPAAAPPRRSPPL